APEAFHEHPELLLEHMEAEDRTAWQACHDGVFNTSGSAHEQRIRIRHADGSERVIQHRCGPVHAPSGRLIGTRASNIDITRQAEHESSLEQMASRDALTGLGNRNALEQRLRRMIDRDRTGFALLFIDLDRFKYINDVYGHALGDEILTDIARRLKANSRENCEAFRFGGDEFVIVLPGADRSRARTCADKVREGIARPVRLGPLEFEVGASIGITLWPDHGADTETLIKNADLAMYEAKRRHCGLLVFETEMARIAADLMSYEHMLRKGLQKGELVAWYQPVMDLRAHRMIGAEALVRWLHPEQGMIAPQRFVAMAEDSGLILPLGKAVFRQATSQLAAWRARGHELRMGINVSIRQLEDSAFIEWARACCIEAGVEPEYVVLEITESLLTENLEQVHEQLLQAREIGFQIALDDFGTGYSSIQYLADMPVTILKLDREMIRRMQGSERHRTLVRSLLEMAHGLGLDVVGEGIEDRETANLLAGRPGVYGQGYLFSPPAPAPEIEEKFLRNDPSDENRSD
ncbi:MAG: EAL domain-containing protein, partial [Gammaproteobacteria bacterium]